MEINLYRTLRLLDSYTAPVQISHYWCAIPTELILEGQQSTTASPQLSRISRMLPVSNNGSPHSANAQDAASSSVKDTLAYALELLGSGSACVSSCNNVATSSFYNQSLEDEEQKQGLPVKPPGYPPHAPRRPLPPVVLLPTAEVKGLRTGPCTVAL